MASAARQVLVLPAQLGGVVVIDNTQSKSAGHGTESAFRDGGPQRDGHPCAGRVSADGASEERVPGWTMGERVARG